MDTVRDDSHWGAYNARQQARAVRLLCKEVLAAAGMGAGRVAIDFGCGVGVETRAMLTSGWRVLALDGEPGTRDRVLATTQGSAREWLTIETIHFPDLTVLPAADLVYAGYSLPYIHPDDFDRVWGLIRSSLRPGAWFAGNFFGDRDSWADNPVETFLSEEAARALFEGMEIVSFNEEDEDGQADSGPKHWHVFDVIAVNRACQADARAAAFVSRPTTFPDTSHRPQQDPLRDAQVAASSCLQLSFACGTTRGAPGSRRNARAHRG